MSGVTQSPGEIVLAPRSDLCLDFANTLSWRGSAPTESLNSPADLIAWCAAAGAISVRAARELGAQAKDSSGAELFSQALALREALYRIFHAIATGRAPADEDLDLLSRALRLAPIRIGVARSGAGFGWRVEHAAPSASTVLAAVLWSAGDLLVGPARARVRCCANPQCLWLFMDGSKNGTRRWCSMQSCGNRAKAHRHYLRHKRG